MKKIIVNLLMLSLVSCTGKNHVETEDYKVRSAAKSVSAIQLEKSDPYTGETLHGSCSAVSINYKGKFRTLTAAHCCDETNIKDTQNKNKKILKIKRSVDLCEIELIKTEKYSSIEVGKLSLFDKLQSVGIQPIGTDLANKPLVRMNIYEGRISAFTNSFYINQNLDSDLVISTAQLHRGMSGGGTFRNGKLIGINSMTLTGTNDGIVIPTTEIIKFLNE